jgi:hypothetical protein
MSALGLVRVPPLEPNTPTTSESGNFAETAAAVMKREFAAYLPETASIGVSCSTPPKDRTAPTAPAVDENRQE